ncbi:MAG: hypothetical protein ACLPKB_32590, partial [Xanthobacteraceae bacterium]
MSYTLSAFAAATTSGLTQSRKQAGVKGRRLNFLYAVLGSVVSGGALICLLQMIFRVGLAPVLADGLGSFQEIVHFFTEPIMTVLAGVLPFAVPEWYCDLWVISFVLTALNLQDALIGVRRDGKAWLVSARMIINPALYPDTSRPSRSPPFQFTHPTLTSDREIASIAFVHALIVVSARSQAGLSAETDQLTGTRVRRILERELPIGAGLPWRCTPRRWIFDIPTPHRVA